MSEQVQFDEQGSEYQSMRTPQEVLGAIESLVIKTGIASDKKQANYVLVGIAVIAIGATLFLFFNANQIQPPKLSEETLNKMQSTLNR